MERQTSLEAVDVPPALTLTLDVPGVREVGDDPLSCTLGDVEEACDIADANTLISGYQQQHVAMVRDKPELWPIDWGGGRRWFGGHA